MVQLKLKIVFSVTVEVITHVDMGVIRKIAFAVDRRAPAAHAIGNITFILQGLFQLGEFGWRHPRQVDVEVVFFDLVRAVAIQFQLAELDQVRTVEGADIGGIRPVLGHFELFDHDIIADVDIRVFGVFDIDIRFEAGIAIGHRDVGAEAIAIHLDGDIIVVARAVIQLDAEVDRLRVVAVGFELHIALHARRNDISLTRNNGVSSRRRNNDGHLALSSCRNTPGAPPGEQKLTD